jgi:hypothetical protein
MTEFWLTKDGLRSVRASSIRSISICEDWSHGDPAHLYYKVIGWFDTNESFEFGIFSSLVEAKIFRNRLHNND